MTESLQYEFGKSKGGPLRVGQFTVVQMDQIPISRGVIHLRFLSPPDALQGVRLDTDRGSIELSDGSTAKRIGICAAYDPGRIEEKIERKRGGGPKPTRSKTQSSIKGN